MALLNRVGLSLTASSESAGAKPPIVVVVPKLSIISIIKNVWTSFHGLYFSFTEQEMLMLQVRAKSEASRTTIR